MSRNKLGLIWGAVILLFALGMGAFHLLLTGISEDFGTGVVVGLALGVGSLALLSRNVREIP
jgi:hypothetical protein